MALSTQPKAKRPDPKPASRIVPLKPSQVLPSKGLMTLLLGSLGLFLVTLYVTSWTSTGPTLLPSEAFTQAAQDALNPAGWNLVPPGTRYLPEGLQVPTDSWQVLEPMAIALGIVIALRYIPSNNWTRLVVKTLVVLLAMRYMAWRTLGDTLNLSTPLTIVLSLWIYGVELWGFMLVLLSNFQSIWTNGSQRHAEADRYEADLRSGQYLPSVDVMVTTYNEQDFILRRTLVGCLELEYPGEINIYICDDGRRPHVRALAESLGCHYITQPDGFVNRNAKAGNLNNAWPRTQGEIMVLFDADFVPFKNFLMRTIGFFQDPKVALLQTPQDFYNPDSHVRNLGLAEVMPNDLQSFFKHQQMAMDTAGAAVCCGTSYIVRRQALIDVGGYYTGSIAEDSPTSMRMLTAGYRTIYLNEKISMGESPRSIGELVSQRLRWLQSNLQIMINRKDVPVFAKLNWVQRSYFLMFFAGEFFPLMRLTFLVSPLLCMLLGVTNYVASLNEFLYYCGPYLLLMTGTSAWVANYHISFIYRELFEVLMCFPGSQRIFQFFLLGPYGKYGSAVTLKGVLAHKKTFNLRLTWPLILLSTISVALIALQILGRRLGLWENFQTEEYSLLFFWVVYNLFLMGMTILSAIDQPERRQLDRFPLQVPCELQWDNGCRGWGTTVNLSESGALLKLLTPQAWNGRSQPAPGDSGQMLLPQQNLQLQTEVVRPTLVGDELLVSLKFPQLSASQYRQLVATLYTQPNWWKRTKQLGVVDSLLALAGAVLKLKPLLATYGRSQPRPTPRTIRPTALAHLPVKPGR